MKRTHKIVRGVVDATSGTFSPYPLPVFGIPVRDESVFSVDLSVFPDERELWLESGGNTPLVVEFRSRAFLPDTAKELSQYLLDRARRLNVDVAMLPAVSTLDVSLAEEAAMLKARRAIADALFYVILRWSNLEEGISPNRVRVPVRLVDPELPGWSGSIESFIRERASRDMARRLLSESDLLAFEEYCRMWDGAHGGPNPCVGGDDGVDD